MSQGGGVDEIERNVLARDCRQAEKLTGILGSGVVGEFEEMWQCGSGEVDEIERNVLARDCRQAEKLTGISGSGAVGEFGEMWQCGSVAIRLQPLPRASPDGQLTAVEEWPRLSATS